MGTLLESIFESVDSQVVHLSYTWKIYCQLFDSEDNISLLDSSGGNVFQLFQTLILDHVILALSRLTDPPSHGKGKENANIRYVLELAKDSLSPRVLANVTASLARLDGHVAHLRVYRNKVLAHPDLAHAIRLTDLPPITYDELENAMCECRTLMSMLGMELFKRTSAYDVIIPYGRSGSDLLTRLRGSRS